MLVAPDETREGHQNIYLHFLEQKKFKRKIEDFICGHCDAAIKGNGYTNHCPNCLWSKHVDINPGDRAALCGGMMRPVAVEKDGDEYIILHKCEMCGHEKRNKAGPEDSIEELSKI